MNYLALYPEKEEREVEAASRCEYGPILQSYLRSLSVGSANIGFFKFSNLIMKKIPELPFKAEYLQALIIRILFGCTSSISF